MLSDEAKERRKAAARERYATDPTRKQAVKDAALKSRRTDAGKTYMRAYYAAHKINWNKRTQEQRDSYNAKRREKYASDPEFRKKLIERAKSVPSGAPEEKRKRRLKDSFGLSIEEHDFMLTKQGWGCGICGREHSDTTGRRLAVDHCHRTGNVRGLLCGRCNSGLGQFADSEELLRKAIEYLNRPRSGIMGSLVQPKQRTRRPGKKVR